MNMKNDKYSCSFSLLKLDFILCVLSSNKTKKFFFYFFKIIS